MNLALINISTDKSAAFLPDKKTAEAINLLNAYGHSVSSVLSICSGLDEALEYIGKDKEGIIIYGETGEFVKTLAEKYSINEANKVFELDKKIIILGDNLCKEFVEETVIPTLNFKSKSFYTSQIFRTFGKSIDELKKMLSSEIKNKNKIVFSFIDFGSTEVEIQARYSNKTDVGAVQEIMNKTNFIIKDILFSYRQESLAEAVIGALIAKDKKLRVAESFTGGKVCSELVAVAGASKVLLEGVVAYSKEAKAKRLGVDSRLIDEYGASSLEVIYEMAANLFIAGKTDFVLCTNGDAGPEADEKGKVGKFNIAVGDYKEIKCLYGNFSGTRGEIIDFGVKMALFKLLGKIGEGARG